MRLDHQTRLGYVSAGLQLLEAEAPPPAEERRSYALAALHLLKDWLAQEMMGAVYKHTATSFFDALDDALTRAAARPQGQGDRI